MKTKNERQAALLSSILEPAMDALAATLASNHEVVLHNLTTPAHSVQKIINGHVSGRVKGDSLLAGPDKDEGFAGLFIKKENNTQPVVIKNYKTVTASGKTLSSASTVYYSEQGEPLMAFCLNVDNSPYEQIRKGMESLMQAAPVEPETPDKRLTHLVEETIQEIINRHSVPNQKIQKAQRLKIVAEMRDRGIFKMKGGVQHAARAMGVTRYTVYNDLEVVDEK